MSTFTLDSDLSAVNSILAAIGQAPTTAAALDDAYTNLERLSSATSEERP